MSRNQPAPFDAETRQVQRLAQALRLEQRTYLEQAEAAVADSEAARTPLDLRLMQLGNRSVEISVDVADRQLRGRVAHVSGDLATLETVGGDRFVLVIDRIAAVRFRNEPGSPRAVDTGEPSTLVAKLRAVWNAGERCTVGRTTGPAVVGDLTAVTDGHVEIVDPQGTHWLLDHGAIAWIGPKV